MSIFKKKTEAESFEEVLIRKILATETFKKLAEEAKKNWELEQLKATDLNYGIIKDLFNQAKIPGATVHITLRDGTTVSLASTPLKTNKPTDRTYS
jgi:hypothetical protein